jgi:pyridoxal phosphate phosphatase PHOSPHO2
MPVVWDFDHSLIPDANSDTHIPAALHPPSAAFIRAGAAAGQPWTPLMAATLALLHGAGVTPAALTAAAAQLPSHPALLAAVRALHARGAAQYILSDANSLYIAAFLAAHGLQPCIAAVRTNPARVEASGLVALAPYHAPPPGCPRCPPNLCKGRVLEEELRPLAAAAAAAAAAGAAGGGGSAPGGDKWVYVGDGGGDLCPCLRLGAGDVILARRGWELHKRLQREAPAARVVAWEGGEDLAAALQREVLGEA